jgi:hypothetical protein
MLYVINNKFYILAAGYYREVIVKVNPADKNDYVLEVVRDSKKIEANDSVVRQQISVEEAYKKNKIKSEN